MIDHGKRNVVGVLVDTVDYEAAVSRILNAASTRKPFGVSALAVHGVMIGATDPEHRYRLNSLDLVVPDGQPVRWAIQLLYGLTLPDRVYGPRLMLIVCERAAKEGFPVFLYGSKRGVVEALAHGLQERFPALRVAGYAPSKFRALSPTERDELVQQIVRSGAKILFVGLGCPRQEIFAYEMKDRLKMPVLAVGAAFDFHSGAAKEAPVWMQRMGLQWFHRLIHDPRRLWYRYLILNPWFLTLLVSQWAGMSTPDTTGTSPERDLIYG